jgi:hypothetical protein
MDGMTTTVVRHCGSGTAVLERRTSGLYLGGRRLVLWQSERQRGNELTLGRDIQAELDATWQDVAQRERSIRTEGMP